MSEEKLNEIYAIIFAAIGAFLLLSLISFHPGDLQLYVSTPNAPIKNFTGFIGAHIAGVLYFILGLAAFIVPFLSFVWAANRLLHASGQKIYLRIGGTIFLMASTSAILSILAGSGQTAAFKGGGLLGLVISDFLLKTCSLPGSLLILATLFALSFVLATNFLIIPIIRKAVFGLWRWVKGGMRLPKLALQRPVYLHRKDGRAAEPRLRAEPDRARPDGAGLKTEGPRLKRMEGPVVKTYKPGEAAGTREKPQGPREVEVKIHPKPEPDAKGTPKPAAVNARSERGEYNIPATGLLNMPPPIEERKLKEDLKVNSEVLESTLLDFDVEAKVVRVEQGPAITRYELEPAPGVKVNRISALSDDIALAMKAQSVRVVAPIPGKGTVGIEVPNASTSLVFLREIVESDEFKKAVSEDSLPIILGKDIAGKPVITDLGDMPHLLIAGTTGSGKTVCVNSIIASLLYSLEPDELKLLMIDPKMVELAVYNGLPHLLSPVITDAKKASASLGWVVNEMERRYKMLAHAGARNIRVFNEKISANGGSMKDESGNPLEKLPFIIVIIDELADLMLIARDTIENAITRLAQLSRAVGIHIILATQRPSVDVITGVIKANFPSRISFKVASKVDSRTVLDMNGADKLLGRGDMLFVEPGASKAIRAQGSLIKDLEIERITNFIKSQRAPEYVEEILEAAKRPSFKKFEKDEVYEEAVRFVLETRQASVSMLQRRLGLGYTRAARLIDMMEDEGIVGPYQGSKPRDILLSVEEYQAKSGK